MSPFAGFERSARTLEPRTAVVLGSGLAAAATSFRETDSIPFGDIPGLVPTTVPGHKGRLALGLWDDTPVLLFFGRLHFYEGHTREIVTGPVRVAAELGVKRLVLTNAAGGIHPALAPGALMAIHGHLKLIGRECARELSTLTPIVEPYTPRLIEMMSGIRTGVYAALTGPSYETPAEIRALAACGADAVGMSTALEAEAAAALGLDVAAISCITNRAAGLGGGALDHAEVLANAKLGVERLGGLVTSILRAD
jgi:purine-nucleoside phosphorylase